MKRTWITKLRTGIATSPGLRRAVIAIPVLLLLAGLGLKILVDTDLILSPPPSDFLAVTSLPVYRINRGWSVTASKTLRNAAGESPTFPDANGEFRYIMQDKPGATLQCGYSLVHQAGPDGLRSWFGEESLWIRATSVVDGTAPDAATLDKLLADATPGLLNDPVLIARSVGITVVHPTRTFLNWRGFAGWWAAAIMLLGSLLLLLGCAMLWRIGQRPALVNAGLCPKCRYPIRALNSDRCPECGELLSTYEQTIVSAQLPTASNK